MVCRKCPKRGGIGKRDAKRFLAALRDAVKARFGKKHARVVEVGCLDLCPKRRIAVLVASPDAPMRVVLAAPSAAPLALLGVEP